MEHQWKTTIAPLECRLRSLWSRYMELRDKVDALRREAIQLEFDKTRLAYECDSLRRYAESWKHAEESSRRMAATLSKQMSSALKILCDTEVCSDGRSIADHMRDAHKKLGLLPEEPEQEKPQANANDEFYF